MIRFCAPLLLLCAADAGGSVALPASPEAAARRFATLNNEVALQSGEGKELLAGELETLSAPGGGTLPPPDTVIRTAPGRAVARLPGAAGADPDFYLSLEESKGGWRVTAIRALALTGLVEEIIRLDAQAPSEDPEMRLAVLNAKLTLATDKELLRWAEEHRALFARARTEPHSAELVQALKAAGATSVLEGDGRLVISIGGILDNEVGFLLPTTAPLPAIDGHTYIWIEPAIDGWYLFKTT